MEIRAAEPRDVATVFRFIRELAEFERRAHEVVGSVEQLHEDLFGARPACDVLMADHGGESVGFALFFPVYSTFETRACLHLEDLYVVPEMRGRGLGLALLRRVAAVAHERGCPRLEWTVLDWNADAIAFYERHGARLLPDWRICRVTGAGIAALATGEEN
jgi:GNAT superfamily N-acetyltransferase